MTPVAPCIDFEPTVLSDRLVELREAIGASQQAIADAAGIDYLTLVRLELGQVPTPAQMTALVRLYSQFDFGAEVVADLDAGFALAGVG